MKKISILFLTITSLVFTGCAGMSQTDQRVMKGTAGGAAGGAAIGAIAGNAGMGAAIGAGVGLVGGYLYDKHKKTEQEAYQKGRQDATQGR